MSCNFEEGLGAMKVFFFRKKVEKRVVVLEVGLKYWSTNPTMMGLADKDNTHAKYIM